MVGGAAGGKAPAEATDDAIMVGKGERAGGAGGGVNVGATKWGARRTRRGGAADAETRSSPAN